RRADRCARRWRRRRPQSGEYRRALPSRAWHGRFTDWIRGRSRTQERIAQAGRRDLTGWVLDFVLLAAIWGASFLFMRVGAVEFGAVPTAAVRVAIASIFLLPILAWRGQVGVLRQHWKKVFAIGVINSGIPFLCFAFALLSITSGLSAILNATVPLFGALVAWFWLNDRLAPSRMLGLAIGFGGVALLAWDQASFKPDASGGASGWAVLA